MDYVSVVWILGIMFWVLAALAIVCLLAYTYIQSMYYHWSKEDRNGDIFRENLLADVEEIINSAIENNSLQS